MKISALLLGLVAAGSSDSSIWSWNEDGELESGNVDRGQVFLHNVNPPNPQQNEVIYGVKGKCGGVVPPRIPNAYTECWVKEKTGRVTCRYFCSQAEHAFFASKKDMKAAKKSKNRSEEDFLAILEKKKRKDKKCTQKGNKKNKCGKYGHEQLDMAVNLIRLPDNKPKITCDDKNGKKWKDSQVLGYACAHVPGYNNHNDYVLHPSKEFKKPGHS